MSSPVCAAYLPGDPNTVYLATGLTFDDNVLLLNDAEPVPRGYGSDQRGDFIGNYTLGAQLQKQWLGQAFSFNTSYTLNHYQNYSAFEYTQRNNQLGWNWVLGDRLSGVLSASDQRALPAAEDADLGERDIVQTRGVQGSMNFTLNHLFELDGDAGPLGDAIVCWLIMTTIRRSRAGR